MTAAARSSALLRLMPAVFVLIWSTGFIVARYGMPHAPPMKFLALRYALSVLCFGLWVKLADVKWPQGREQWLHLGMSGLLMHGVYLGGVWAAVKLGMGAGLIALLVGLQPVLTALWVSARGHRTSAQQWLGLALGLAGLMLVVWQKLGLGEVHPSNVACALLALLGITAGTLYQKRFVAPCDVRSASFVQLVAALALTLPLAGLESEAMQWWRADGTAELQLFGAMAWSVFGLTLGGSSLLYLLIQRGAAATVTSWLYLVPPTTALMAWALFGEPFTVQMAVGMALTALGVALAIR